MSDDGEGIIALLSVVGIIVMMVLGPLILIWCIRTLFLTNTPYGFWEWLACLLIGGLPFIPKIKKHIGEA